MQDHADAVPVERRLVLAVVDLRKFAKVSAAMSPVQTFRLLDTFYRVISEAVRPPQGTVVKFIGDAALMVFEARRAADAVATLRHVRREAAAVWDPVSSGSGASIKAHVGTVACGPIGPDGRFDVIGKAVNELFMMPATGDETLSKALLAELDAPSGPLGRDLQSEGRVNDVPE